MLPAAVSGKSEIKVIVVASDGAVLAEAKSILVVMPKVTPPQVSALPADKPPAPPPPQQPPQAQAPPPPQTMRPPTSPLTPMNPEDRERAMRLLKRGDEQLAQGGIAQARLFYERAAEAGLVQGAMALASTYDPDELGRLGVLGLQPDRAVAARWYERARQLGSVEAAQRLQRLGAR